MAIQKKHGKGRLDKWYKLAKEKGYRARAAFKLIQLNRKYGFLESSKVVLDLCAAPGSWCQVAAETMPQNSLIVGVDLAPIKAIPKVITFQSDITTDKCRATIRTHLKTWKADAVLHDGAPNVGVAWVQDAFSQAELVLQALRLATDFLAPNGTFVTKVFRSKDYNALVWIFNQLFDKVEATKPPSSRDVSAEIFVVCRGFKAPKRIDPKLLDPRTVFAELAPGKPNMEAKVFNPAEKRRKREGYEEGDYMQFKETTASEFVTTDDPISMLGTYNKFNFIDTEAGDSNVALRAIDKMDITTPEIRSCCEDLKVLGRKDFKHLLKWRLRAREILGYKSTPIGVVEGDDDDEEAQVEPMDEELRLQKELQDLKEVADSRKKRTRRRENEQKRKEIIRMELNMEAPMDIGIEQSTALGEGALFSTRNAENSQTVQKLSHGRMATITPIARPEPESESESEDNEEDRLDTELDQMYEQYQERKAMIDPKSRSKRLRTEDKDGEWHGIESNSESDSDEIIEEDGSDDSDEETHDVPESKTNGSSLSRKAQNFFSQDLFKDIDGISNHDEEESDDEPLEAHQKSANVESGKKLPLRTQQDHKLNVAQPKITKTASDDVQDEDTPEMESDQSSEASDEEDEDQPDWETMEGSKEAEPSIEIITAEAMTLAQQIASGQKTSTDAIDDGFNKYSFRDVDGLPEWFLDDEGKHSKKNRPITASGAAAIKEKQRLLNARPIKKVREAQGRKKMRAARRLEKLRKKSSLLADDEGMSERDKAQSIAKVMSKAAKKQRRDPVKLVVARGGNRGISGRPRGVKGRYKIVDPRLKKDTRALKRISKSKK